MSAVECFCCWRCALLFSEDFDGSTSSMSNSSGFLASNRLRLLLSIIEARQSGGFPKMSPSFGPELASVRRSLDRCQFDAIRLGIFLSANDDRPVNRFPSEQSRRKLSVYLSFQFILHFLCFGRPISAPAVVYIGRPCPSLLGRPG